VTSEPPGATIFIDDESAGLAPVTVRLEPGAHAVEARLTGHVTARQQLTLTPDGDHRAQLVLEAREAPAVETPVADVPSEEEIEERPSDERPRGVGAGPWIVLGAGLAVALAGSVLEIVAFSEAEPPEQFDSMSELNAWQGRVADLSTSGYVLIGVGSATLVAGLIWALVRRSRSRAGSDSSRRHPSGALVLGGAPSVLWRVSF